MFGRVVPIFFAAALVTSASAQTSALKTGDSCHLIFTDVDGNQLSTFEGHVTLIAVTTRQEEEKARATGDRVPDQYIGDPRYRFVTVLNFQGKIPSPLQGVTKAIVRHRLDEEAKRMQPRYSAAHLTRNPRRDMFAVADFDGTIVKQFGIDPTSAEFAAFLFNGEGRLLRHWSEVPSQAELAESLGAVKLAASTLERSDRFLPTTLRFRPRG